MTVHTISRAPGSGGSTGLGDLPKAEGDAALAADQGLPVMGVDPVAQEFQFLRTRNGVLQVETLGDPTSSAPRVYIASEFATGPDVVALTHTVPALAVHALRAVQLSARLETTFRVFDGVTLVGFGVTSAAQPNASFRLEYARVLSGVLTVRAKTRAGAPVADAFVSVELDDLTETPAPTALHVFAEGVTVPGSGAVVLTQTLALLRGVATVNAACRGEARAEVRVNGVLVAVGFTSAASPNVALTWAPARAFSPGDVVTVILHTRSGSLARECFASITVTD